jgi:hypothetical protein
MVELGTIRQADWARFLARAGLAADLPASYAETIAAIASFVDPVIDGEVTGRWNPLQRRWR